MMYSPNHVLIVLLLVLRIRCQTNEEVLIGAGGGTAPHRVPVSDPAAQRAARFAVAALPERYRDLEFCTEAFELGALLGAVVRVMRFGDIRGAEERSYELTALLRSGSGSALTGAINAFPLFRLVSFTVVVMDQPGRAEQMQLLQMASPQRERRLLLDGATARAALGAARTDTAMHGRRVLAVIGAERQWLDVGGGGGRPIDDARSLVFLTLALEPREGRAPRAGSKGADVRLYAVAVPLGPSGLLVGTASVVGSAVCGTARVAVLKGTVLVPRPGRERAASARAAALERLAHSLAAGTSGAGRVAARQVSLEAVHNPPPTSAAARGGLARVTFTVTLQCARAVAGADALAHAALCAGSGGGVRAKVCVPSNETARHPRWCSRLALLGAGRTPGAAAPPSSAYGTTIGTGAAALGGGASGPAGDGGGALHDMNMHGMGSGLTVLQAAMLVVAGAVGGAALARRPHPHGGEPARHFELPSRVATEDDSALVAGQPYA